MILEGIVTTISPAGEVNIAPMGPRVDAEMRRLLLRPFNTSQTYRNLRQHGEGVFHVTDDVLLLAQISLDLIRQVMDHYYDAIDNWRQSAQGPIQNWPTLDGKEGFGDLQRMRPQSRPQPGSQNDGIHE